MITAIVHAADGVRLITTASSLDVLFGRLAEYVRARYDDLLWADAAGQVRALLDQGDLRAAVTLYFDRTGERWDEERLDMVTVGNGEYWIPDEEQVTHAGR